MTNKEYIKRRDEILADYVEAGLIEPQFDSVDTSIAAEAIDELINDIAFAAMESCEPDCDEVRHSIHQGSWDTMNRIEQIVGADEEN